MWTVSQSTDHKATSCLQGTYWTHMHTFLNLKILGVSILKPVLSCPSICSVSTTGSKP